MTPTLRRLNDRERYWGLTWPGWAPRPQPAACSTARCKLSPFAIKPTVTIAALILATIVVLVLGVSGQALSPGRQLLAIVHPPPSPHAVDAARRAGAARPGPRAARRLSPRGPRPRDRGRDRRGVPALAARAGGRGDRSPRAARVARRSAAGRRGRARRPDRHHRRALRAGHRVRPRPQHDHRRPRATVAHRAGVRAAVPDHPRPPGPADPGPDRPGPDQRCARAPTGRRRGSRAARTAPMATTRSRGRGGGCWPPPSRR